LVVLQLVQIMLIAMLKERVWHHQLGRLEIFEAPSLQIEGNSSS